ncbi:hypothetical protein V6N11_051610 [Hibiscus sabdariffa]|uniref:Aminotransferase class I/classII large domain-containing protein n=1 Tax=Hibiscus sabdariffa TaxID=183260 RepID=A0ABR2U7J1_9ROSI
MLEFPAKKSTRYSMKCNHGIVPLLKYLFLNPLTVNGFSRFQVLQLLLFSGNDYLGLSSHPAVRKAAAKAAQEYGMGPRGSPLIFGYTYHHRLLESSLASLKNKEDCLLCPTGFSANMALMVALGNIASLLATGNKPLKNEKITIFSDELNHASIIDACLAWMETLHQCWSLYELRRKHNLLLVIDDAHGTFVCGKSGGGVAEEFDCERDVDICIGTLSKAAGCHGGFIACRGRSFIFSTATPVPIAAAAHAAVIVAKRENWRRRELWNRVQEFCALTGTTTSSPIISLVVGSEEKAVKASRQLLKSGFHVTAIRPPTVPPNSCRLQIALSAAHTTDDLKKLTSALSSYINFQDIDSTEDGESRMCQKQVESVLDWNEYSKDLSMDGIVSLQNQKGTYAQQSTLEIVKPSENCFKGS